MVHGFKDEGGVASIGSRRKVGKRGKAERRKKIWTQVPQAAAIAGAGFALPLLVREKEN